MCNRKEIEEKETRNLKLFIRRSQFQENEREREEKTA